MDPAVEYKQNTTIFLNENQAGEKILNYFRLNMKSYIN